MPTTTTSSLQRFPPVSAPHLIIHVPHASTVIPNDLRSAFLLSPEETERERLVMTDHFTDALFVLPPEIATTVRFPVSRLVVDPERFTDDAQERMATKGMGVIYTRTSDGRPLREPPSEAERTALLARFYEPHHEALASAVRAALDAHDSCLVLDAHSFPARPLPYEEDQSPDRPDICIGTDPLHTPDDLRDAAVRAFEGAGFEVCVDRPFAGALVPMAYYRRDMRVKAIMVEVNRRLYMDETTGARLHDFDRVRARLLDALRVVTSVDERGPFGGEGPG